MRYTIRIAYRTGNSFGSHDEEDEVPITWENLDRAKEALTRIVALNEAEKRHNDFMTRHTRDHDADRVELVKLTGEVRYPEVSMMLPLDDGREQSISTYWRGYFERLQVAEIVPVKGENSDMKYEPN